MPRFDKILIGLLLGFAPPIFFFLVALIIWFYFDRNENYVLYYTFSGLLLGLIINLRYFKGWIIHHFKLPIWMIVGLYLFYNIVMYGMFMGFPVFNLLWGVIAGYYYGLRIHYLNLPSTQYPRIINQVSIFTALTMTLICISSALIALAGNGVGKDLQMMFGLNFEVTKPMITVIALIGGVMLIGLQYYITNITMRKTILFANSSPK